MGSFLYDGRLLGMLLGGLGGSLCTFLVFGHLLGLLFLVLEALWGNDGIVFGFLEASGDPRSLPSALLGSQRCLRGFPGRLIGLGSPWFVEPACLLSVFLLKI